METVVTLIEEELKRLRKSHVFQLQEVSAEQKRKAAMSILLSSQKSLQLFGRNYLQTLPLLETIAAGDAKLSITLDLEDPIDADFRFMKDEQFAICDSSFYRFKRS